MDFFEWMRVMVRVGNGDPCPVIYYFEFLHPVYHLESFGFGCGSCFSVFIGWWGTLQYNTGYLLALTEDSTHVKDRKSVV